MMILNKHNSIPCGIYQLRIELIVLSLDPQMGDPRIEYQVERVDGNFLRNICLTAN